MACGDKEACPKGGRPEYRNGPQYELVQGKPQGDRMHAKNEKACGYGLYADEPCVYTTIEQKVSALRMWYDEVLKDTTHERREPGAQRAHREHAQDHGMQAWSRAQACA